MAYGAIMAAWRRGSVWRKQRVWQANSIASIISGSIAQWRLYGSNSAHRRRQHQRSVAKASIIWREKYRTAAAASYDAKWRWRIKRAAWRQNASRSESNVAKSPIMAAAWRSSENRKARQNQRRRRQHAAWHGIGNKAISGASAYQAKYHCAKKAKKSRYRNGVNIGGGEKWRQRSNQRKQWHRRGVA